MKSQERHHLKQNEFAHTAARVATTVSENRDRALMLTVGVVVLAVAIGAYFWWAKRSADAAGALLGQAMSIVQAPIVPPPTVPGATQAPGTFPTEKAREEAAVQALQRVASQYGSTDAGLVAKYQLGALHLSMGRGADAEQAFRDVVQSGESVYAASAKLGVAEALIAQSKFDDAIRTLTELSGDRNGPLPIDGVLMQLARTCAKAGKPQEARAAYKRIVDEFPESGYVPEARQELTAIG